MNNISFQDYYPKYFLKDKKYYESLNKPTCFCARVTWSFIRDGLLEDENFVDAKKYLICEYELSLIGQILYTYFPREYYEVWVKNNPGYEHKSCIYGTPASDVLLGVMQAESYVITKLDILEADKFFMDYLFNILSKEDLFNNMSQKEFMLEIAEKIKNDSTVKFVTRLIDQIKN